MGPATSGKTTLALKFLAQAQADGGQVGYIDQARYFDPDYAHRCDLDLSRLLVGRPYDLREALAMTESLVRSGGLSALVFDADALDFLWTNREAMSRLAAFLDRLPAPLARSGMAFLLLHESPTGHSAALSALAHLAVTHPQWLRYFIRRDSKDLLRPGDANTFLLTIGGQLATLCPHLFHPENLE